MKVSLISYTPDAAALLMFTKSTRLNMTADSFESFKRLTSWEYMADLEYMAKTIKSSWEFVDYVFMVEGVSRAYTHQQVRTRAGSYAQQSMRVNDMRAFDFVYPPSADDKFVREYIDLALSQIKEAYEVIMSSGAPAEDARSILPTNISTNIVCKFNLRTLSELVASRSGGRTQQEYQAVVNAMADEVLNVHPWAKMFLFPKDRDYFADIEEFALKAFPDLKQRGELLKIVDAMRKG